MPKLKYTTVPFLTLLAYGNPVQAELSSEHMRLMERFTAESQGCIYHEVPGSCERADVLARQATAIGICWEAEGDVYYCKENATPAANHGFPYSYSDVRKQFQQLSETERHELQTALFNGGHYSGAIDGLFGPGTSNAIIAALQSQGAQVIEVLDMTTPDTIMSGFRRVLTVSSADPVAPVSPPVAVTLSPSEESEYPFVGDWRCVEHSDESEMAVRFSTESISLPEMGLTVDYSEVNSIGGRDTAFHVHLRDGQAVAIVEIKNDSMVMISPLGVHSCDNI